MKYLFRKLLKRIHYKQRIIAASERWILEPFNRELKAYPKAMVPQYILSNANRMAPFLDKLMNQGKLFR